MSSVPASLLGAPAAGASQRAWRISGAVVLVLAAVFVLYWPSADSLMQLWSDTGRTTYTHGFIIAAIVVYLVLRKRDRLASIPWAPSVPASLLVALLGFAWLIAVQGVIELIHQLLMLAVLWTSVWALFGLRIARQLWIPVGFLIFAIPAWDQIIFLLQEATVAAVALMLLVSSIPAYVDGNTVHLAAGVFEVAGGCSGIHFFIVALALATLYGEIGRDSMKVRILLVGLAGILALLANWLRVYTIVLAGHLTNMQHPLVQEGHYNFGWAVFAVMMLLYLFIARRIVPPVRDEISAPAMDGIAAGGARAGSMLIALACVAAMPAWAILNPVEPAVLPAEGASLPQPPTGWSRVSSGSPAWNPVYIGADREERGEYVDALGRHLEVFVATYAMQRQNKELIAYGNSLIGANEGAVVSGNRAAPDAQAQEIVIEHAYQRSLIRYYYRVGNRRTTRGIVAQLWYGLGVLGGATPSSVVAMRVRCEPDCDSAHMLLNEFSGQ
jgi:exosortase A